MERKEVIDQNMGEVADMDMDMAEEVLEEELPGALEEEGMEGGGAGRLKIGGRGRLPMCSLLPR